eukprot:symbB.v1.2.027708.t1/scaffold2863.1/size68590/11
MVTDSRSGQMEPNLKVNGGMALRKGMANLCTPMVMCTRASVYHHADGSRYVGEWRDDQKEGQAIEEWADNSRFEGQYRAGKKHGHGTFSWPEGSSYEGEFENNEIHGQGTYFWNDGRVYRGEWANNRMSGTGTFTWRDGRKYVGSYQHDKKDGHGVFTWPDGREYDGKQHGIGVFKTAKGDFRRGEWKAGATDSKHQNNSCLEYSCVRKGTESAGYRKHIERMASSQVPRKKRLPRVSPIMTLHNVDPCQ